MTLTEKITPVEYAKRKNVSVCTVYANIRRGRIATITPPANSNAGVKIDWNAEKDFEFRSNKRQQKQ